MEALAGQLVAVPAAVVVCGKKNTGKSFSCRRLINALLEKGEPGVAFLECDSGQPDFTMPGMLSLHYIESHVDVATPALRTPLLQHYFGSHTSQREPGFYVACIQSLFDFFAALFSNAADEGEQQKARLPSLVVNTNGWITGTGLDCLLAIVKHVQPSHVVHCRQPEGKDMAEWTKAAIEEAAEVALQFHSRQMDGLVDAPPRKRAADHRERLLRNYFDVTPELPLMLQNTYSVPWSHLRVCVMHHPVHPTRVLDAINGLMGGLCIDRSPYASTVVPVTSDAPEGSWEDMPLVLQSTPIVECVGAGVIRDIDVENKLYQVITPVPMHVLQHVNTFLRGDVEIPTGVLVEGSTTDVPYLCTDSLGASDCAAALPMKKARPTLVRQHQLSA